MSNNKNKQILNQAKELIFPSGPKDAARDLCEEVTKFGLAKIIFALRKLGFSHYPSFIGAADMTVTRNEFRFKDGFGYGGSLSWGDGNKKLIILNVRPNACGLVCFGLEKYPDEEKFLKKCEFLSTKEMDIDGVKQAWDITNGNHFILLGELKPLVPETKNLPPYFCIIHAGSAWKEPNKFGPGLYIEKSPQLQKWAKEIKTPWGSLHVLIGEHAETYYEFYKKGSTHAQKTREKYGEIMFDKNDYKVLCNHTHQGLWSMNEILLGCQKWQTGDIDTLFPVTLNPNTPAYLVKGTQNFNPAVIELEGWKERALEYGVYERLLTANILPHGGGYALPQYEGVKKVVSINGKRFFFMKLQDKKRYEILEYPTSSYEYRDSAVINRVWELGMGRPVAKLIPRLSLKV